MVVQSGIERRTIEDSRSTEAKVNTEVHAWAKWVGVFTFTFLH